jgi:hypothetical protein
MASVGLGRYVVVVLHVGGTKLADVKLVFQREPRSSKTWFPTCSVTTNEEPVDAAVTRVIAPAPSRHALSNSRRAC